jgi:radical SAM superfamily enzyme YgiQ (UPF0313 family)
MRYRSLENIKMELDYLKQTLHCKEIMIFDDNFNINLDRAKEILKLIIHEKYNFKIQFPNAIRADFFDEEFAKLLKAAGTYKVAIGIESGVQHIVNKIGKNLDLQRVPQTVFLLKKYGIIVWGYFILGFPEESVSDIYRTIQFAKTLNLDNAEFFELMIFPGTRIFEQTVVNRSQEERNLFNRKILKYGAGTYILGQKYSKSPFLISHQYRLLRIKALYDFFLKPNHLIHTLRSLNPSELYIHLLRLFQVIGTFFVHHT